MSADYITSLITAGWMTIQLAFASLGCGLILALIFASCEMTKIRSISIIITTFVTVIRSLPELLVVLFIYYGASEVLSELGKDPDVSPFKSGVIALALIFASYASQTIRGAIKAVPKGQIEASKALGIKKSRTFFKIILPQAVRHALPGLSNQWLVLLKDTALISLIGVTDLMLQARLIVQTTHQSFTWYAIVAIIYLTITIITQQLIKILEYKFSIPGDGR